jgi:hypothetical protein
VQGEYQPLTGALSAVAEQGERDTELGCDETVELVGGLPPSAGLEQRSAGCSPKAAPS